MFGSEAQFVAHFHALETDIAHLGESACLPRKQSRAPPTWNITTSTPACEADVSEVFRLRLEAYVPRSVTTNVVAPA
jgi:hypothetical protein